MILILVRGSGGSVKNELKLQFEGLEMIDDDRPKVNFSKLIVGEGLQERKCNICQEIVR